MIKLQNQLKIIIIFLFMFLGLFLLNNSNQVMAMEKSNNIQINKEIIINKKKEIQEYINQKNQIAYIIAFKNIPNNRTLNELLEIHTNLSNLINYLRNQIESLEEISNIFQ
ncbi:MAG: putative secreted protein [Candidatus Phytoplasma australasiaticum]|nr:putative secreted protein ['Echinacea purpurea' witches'-broom phytoplasma]WKV64150.1 MAG: putative secreted protein [Candidatus Phytoplasma australasiaticum]WMW50172.1 MAG: putative secreted protein [Candidatus Phytoplasma australasiaticum]